MVFLYEVKSHTKEAKYFAKVVLSVLSLLWLVREILPHNFNRLSV